MHKKFALALGVFCLIVSLSFTGPGHVFGATKPFTFGLLLVGP
jgi:hypothetical protein